MRLHRANHLHLFLAALNLSTSDREEMDCLEAGRDPVDVLTAPCALNETTHAISDYLGNVLAIGGHKDGLIWFVHTTHAEKLSAKRRYRMAVMLQRHLEWVKETNPGQVFGNIVSVNNLKHQKLLHVLGAQFTQRVQHNGNQFWAFVI